MPARAQRCTGRYLQRGWHALGWFRDRQRKLRRPIEVSRLLRLAGLEHRTLQRLRRDRMDAAHAATARRASTALAPSAISATSSTTLSPYRHLTFKLRKRGGVHTCRRVEGHFGSVPRTACFRMHGSALAALLDARVVNEAAAQAEARDALQVHQEREERQRGVRDRRI